MCDYQYESNWRYHAYPKDESHLATEDELKKQYSELEVQSGSPILGAGIPIKSDGIHVIADTENRMNMIVGMTGQGKTRLLVAPTITLCALAGINMVITDIKGEFTTGSLSPYIQGVLKENNYRIRVLNFRDFNCDGYNLLLEPYRLYRMGDTDKAMTELHKIFNSLVRSSIDSDENPFWISTATQYLMGSCVSLFETCDDPEKINFLTLASYCSEESCNVMKRVVEKLPFDNNIMIMLKNVLSEPEKTRMSTLATVNSLFSDFLVNAQLLKMLSYSTFSLSELLEEKTALFIILPDETDAFRDITGLIISQISSYLVRAAYEAGGQLKRRFHFICDEFCQFYVPNMEKNIATHRSRNIQWTLVCQSRQQLYSVYGRDAETILDNCTNLFFLSSPETELLEDLSVRAGYTNISPDGKKRRRISVENLRNMKKGWDYSDVYFASGSTVCVNRLPDISKYPFLEKYTERGRLLRRIFPEVKVYTANQMLEDVQTYRRAYEMEMNGYRWMDAADRKAAERYKRFFAAGKS